MLLVTPLKYKAWADRRTLDAVAQIDPSKHPAALAFARQQLNHMIYHLINHGTYHRGAIGHALDLAGAPRPADTYTVFLHAIEPWRREA